MWHKPCRTFHPWCLCIKTRCLLWPSDAIWANIGAGVRRYFYLTISSSPTIFSPLTTSNVRSYCSQISLNYIMYLYNKEPFHTFYGFLQSFIHPRLLIKSINIYPPETLSFNSKEGIMLKYNHFNPKFHGVNTCIWIIKPWYHFRVKFG